MLRLGLTISLPKLTQQIRPATPALNSPVSLPRIHPLIPLRWETWRICRTMHMLVISLILLMKSGWITKTNIGCLTRNRKPKNIRAWTQLVMPILPLINRLGVSRTCKLWPKSKTKTGALSTIPKEKKSRRPTILRLEFLERTIN